MVFCIMGRFSYIFTTGDETTPPANTSLFFSALSQPETGPEASSRNVSEMNPGYSSSLRAFTLAELNTATENFKESNKIGKGFFGIVYKGVVKSLKSPYNDICVAVKRGRRGRGKREQQEFKQWKTEIKVLGKIKHPNLVNLVGYCNEDSGNENNWLLVYEYMPNGSLDDHLSGSSKPPLSWLVRLKIARDAAAGLTYLHEGMGMGEKYQLIFRDFKPSNILLDSQMNAKLSDFGFARDGPQDGRTHVSTMVVGTKGYAAPEYVQTGRLTSKVDVWSYGIFLQELISGRLPVAQTHSEDNSKFLRWTCCYAGEGSSRPIPDPRLGSRYSERSMQLVTSISEKCLLKDPKLRPTMGEVLHLVDEAIALENQQSLNGGRT